MPDRLKPDRWSSSDAATSASASVSSFTSSPSSPFSLTAAPSSSPRPCHAPRLAAPPVAARLPTTAATLVLLAALLPGLARAQVAGEGGTYAGYRVRQNCDPAGGTIENERISATMNFALCCERVGTGEQCCNACLVRVCMCVWVMYCSLCFAPTANHCSLLDPLPANPLGKKTQTILRPLPVQDQFALYFDYSFPCWSKQGGEVMQEKTEEQIDKNFFKWDTSYFRWRCASTRLGLSPATRALAALGAAILAWFAGTG